MYMTKKEERILAVKITVAVTLVVALCFYWVTHNIGL